MSKYFELSEFLHSNTARDNKIENLPTFGIVENLAELAAFLNGLRQEWGSPVKVTSGFRNEALNRLVGGAARSLHLKGLAADLYPANGDFDGFKKFVVGWLGDKDFDEAIIEKDSKGNRWIHIQLYGNNGFQRKKIFSLTKN